jgi:hypothetical protein
MVFNFGMVKQLPQLVSFFCCCLVFFTHGFAKGCRILSILPKCHPCMLGFATNTSCTIYYIHMPAFAIDDLGFLLIYSLFQVINTEELQTYHDRCE